MAQQPLFQKKLQSKRKSNVLAALKVDYVDYKNVKLLRRFMSVFDRILPSRVTGNSPKHQKMVAEAIKRARYMGLIPYTTTHRAPEGERKY